ncbi:MAG TPA: OmpA family protein [Cytophagales bacterium]|nr:OmpA family protein [Cytophagales bacterium]
MRFTLNTLIFLLLCNLCRSQTVLWGSEISYQYNQFGEEEYSAKQALGEPNASLGEISPKAFKMKSDAALGTIIARFLKVEVIRQIVIVESNAPGRVVEVNVYDEKSTKYNVYKNFPQELPESYRLLTLQLPANASYKVDRVEVKLNSIAKKGWCQIDAIGITTSTLPINLNSIKDSNMVASRVNSASQAILNFSSDVETLGEKINTGVTETKPIISADGKTLYFCRQNYAYNVGGKRDDQDIWYAELSKNNEWSYAANIGKPLNDRNPNGVSSVSTDGNTLLLINEYEEGGSFKPGASVSHRIKGGWSKPERLNIERFSNKGIYLDFCFSGSGKVLLMAINKSDSYGDQDIYVSFNKDGNNWAEPINIGQSVNTKNAEFSPFLAADEKTLYFASDGYDGYGGSDIYYTKRLDDTWKNWSKPVNLGAKVNSSDWDGYYSVSAAGDYAYLVSTRNSIGNSKDIYRIGLPKEHKPEPVLLLAGTVYNAKTKQPIGSKIIFETLPNGIEQGIANSNPENGNYKIVLPRGKNYAYLAQASGYLSLEENIDLSNLSDYTEIKKDLYLIPIEVGQKVELKNVFFVRGMATLLENSYPELERLAKLLKENENIHIELAGHTDNRGNAALNFKLSEDRVKVVKEFLVRRGVEGKRIKIKAYGGSKPIASNTTEETRRLNRRVEVTVLSF